MAVEMNILGVRLRMKDKAKIRSRTLFAHTCPRNLLTEGLHNIFFCALRHAIAPAVDLLKGHAVPGRRLPDLHLKFGPRSHVRPALIPLAGRAPGLRLRHSVSAEASSVRVLHCRPPRSFSR